MTVAEQPGLILGQHHHLAGALCEPLEHAVSFAEFSRRAASVGLTFRKPL